jgi:hypothetical protein
MDEDALRLNGRAVDVRDVANGEWPYPSDQRCWAGEVEEGDQQGKPTVTATSWALLGMLSYEHELSGYDIRKWIDWSLRFYYGVRRTARSTRS